MANFQVWIEALPASDPAALGRPVEFKSVLFPAQPNPVELEVWMRIDELLIDPRRREHAATPEADALTERDALQEAQLLDVRLDALRSTVWLLFDCRGALQIEMGNTAVIVAHGLRRLSWTAQPRGRLAAWTVVGSEPVARGTWSLALAFVPSGRLDLEADSAEFFVGNVPGCDEAPPNYTEADDATIRAGLPSWSSTFEPIHAVFLGPALSDPS